MTPEALDALDARCAAAMGLRHGAYPCGVTYGGAQVSGLGWLNEKGELVSPSCPSVTRDPAAFVEALRYCESGFLFPSLDYDGAGWNACLDQTAFGCDPSPMVAFALALASYGERKGGAA